MNHPSKQIKHSPNRLKINAGQWRSRIITFPDAEGLRPTASRVRETVFNWLGQQLTDKVCLDAFAGSGALGFEAASRGAKHVTMCELNAAAAKSLIENAKTLNATNIDIVKQDVLRWLPTQRATFDIVFCDPPFAQMLHAPFLAAIQPFLAEDARVYWESATPLDTLPIVAASYEMVKSSKAGAVYFGLLAKKGVVQTDVETKSLSREQT
jgi:16S rRNA (guanine966-N2)-methyltransferase